MRVLVTGAAGFIGYHISRNLIDAGHTVCGVDAITPYYDVRLKQDRLAQLDTETSFQNHILSLQDIDTLARVFEEFRPDCVIHLAAQAGVRYSIDHPREYVDTNVVGSFNIIELCKRQGVEHLILASTSSAYGANTDYPFTETARAAYPLTIYAATKIASEMIAHSHSHLFDIPTTVLRFFTVYGPWGRPDMAPSLFADAMLSGRPITVFNQGRMSRDFTYIDDLCDAIVKLVPQAPRKNQPVSDVDSLSPVAPYRLVNIGNSDPTALMDFISALEDKIGSKATIEFQDMQAGDVTKTSSDTRLLDALVGERQRTSLKDGISAFIDWYREYHGFDV